MEADASCYMEGPLGTNVGGAGLATDMGKLGVDEWQRSTTGPITRSRGTRRTKKHRWSKSMTTGSALLLEARVKNFRVALAIVSGLVGSAPTLCGLRRTISSGPVLGKIRRWGGL